MPGRVTQGCPGPPRRSNAHRETPHEGTGCDRVHDGERRGDARHRRRNRVRVRASGGTPLQQTAGVAGQQSASGSGPSDTSSSRSPTSGGTSSGGYVVTSGTSGGSVAAAPVARSRPAAAAAPAAHCGGGSTGGRLRPGTSSTTTSSSGCHLELTPDGEQRRDGLQTGVNHGVITVGGIYDETGPVDATVERDTVRSYFDLVNAQGGVNGYKFQLIDCDSAYDPSTAHQCSQKLISEGVLAIVGWLSLSGEQPETQYLDAAGRPDHRRPRRALRVRVAALVPDHAEPRHRGDGARHTRVPGRPQEAGRHLPQRELHRAGRAVVPRRDEEVRHLAGRRRDGRRDEGRLHRRHPQVPDRRRAVGRRVRRPVLVRPHLPGDGAAELASARARAAAWTRRRRTSSTTPAAARAAPSSAPTRRRPCSSTSTTPARRRSRSTSRPSTSTTRASTGRSTSTRRTSGSPPRSSSRRSRISATRRVIATEPRRLARPPHELRRRRHHRADHVRLREPRPAPLPRVDPQLRRALEDDVRPGTAS